MMYDNTEKLPRAILVAVDTGEYDAETSLLELEELARTAGVEVAATSIQKRPAPDSATVVGSGRLRELTEDLERLEADMLIFDCELTGSQTRNIGDVTGVAVVDRTMLILDIFAARARSSEGRLQVELAQLRYRLPRLAGSSENLSRLGGGIGTRGPGETKLETDRRHIRSRIQKLEEELRDLTRRREQMRSRRKKDGIITAAIVGYTNAGKSTLMNTLTDAGVLAEDKLFATLDPTSRALKLPNGVSVMLIDTVGLVRRLPHHLVEAFHSTLEEAALADMILNVCDASSPEAQVHLEVTRKLLADLGCTGRPVIPVMNKCDLVPSLLDIPMIGNAVRISAKTGEGIGDLLAAVEENLPVSLRRVCLLLSFDQAGLVAQIRKDHVLYQEEYRPDGIFVSALLDPLLYGRVREYEILENT
mgnify:CR=1 FL=1